MHSLPYAYFITQIDAPQAGGDGKKPMDASTNASRAVGDGRDPMDASANVPQAVENGKEPAAMTMDAGEQAHDSENMSASAAQALRIANSLAAGDPSFVARVSLPSKTLSRLEINKDTLAIYQIPLQRVLEAKDATLVFDKGSERRFINESIASALYAYHSRHTETTGGVLDVTRAVTLLRVICTEMAKSKRFERLTKLDLETRKEINHLAGEIASVYSPSSLTSAREIAMDLLFSRRNALFKNDVFTDPGRVMERVWNLSRLVVWVAQYRTRARAYGEGRRDTGLDESDKYFSLEMLLAAGVKKYVAMDIAMMLDRHTAALEAAYSYFQCHWARRFSAFSDEKAASLTASVALENFTRIAKQFDGLMSKLKAEENLLSGEEGKLKEQRKMLIRARDNAKKLEMRKSHEEKLKETMGLLRETRKKIELIRTDKLNARDKNKKAKDYLSNAYGSDWERIIGLTGEKKDEDAKGPDDQKESSETNDASEAKQAEPPVQPESGAQAPRKTSHFDWEEREDSKFVSDIQIREEALKRLFVASLVANDLGAILPYEITDLLNDAPVRYAGEVIQAVQDIRRALFGDASVSLPVSQWDTNLDPMRPSYTQKSQGEFMKTVMGELYKDDERDQWDMVLKHRDPKEWNIEVRVNDYYPLSNRKNCLGFQKFIPSQRCKRKPLQQVRGLEISMRVMRASKVASVFFSSDRLARGDPSSVTSVVEWGFTEPWGPKVREETIKQAQNVNIDLRDVEEHFVSSWSDYVTDAAFIGNGDKLRAKIKNMANKVIRRRKTSVPETGHGVPRRAKGEEFDELDEKTAFVLDVIADLVWETAIPKMPPPSGDHADAKAAQQDDALPEEVTHRSFIRQVAKTTGRCITADTRILKERQRKVYKDYIKFCIDARLPSHQKIFKIVNMNLVEGNPDNNKLKDGRVTAKDTSWTSYKHNGKLFVEQPFQTVEWIWTIFHRARDELKQQGIPDGQGQRVKSQAIHQNLSPEQVDWACHPSLADDWRLLGKLNEISRACEARIEEENKSMASKIVFVASPVIWPHVIDLAISCLCVNAYGADAIETIDPEGDIIQRLRGLRMLLDGRQKLGEDADLDSFNLQYRMALSDSVFIAATSEFSRVETGTRSMVGFYTPNSDNPVHNGRVSWQEMNPNGLLAKFMKQNPEAHAGYTDAMNKVHEHYRVNPVPPFLPALGGEAGELKKVLDREKTADFLAKVPVPIAMLLATLSHNANKSDITKLEQAIHKHVIPFFLAGAARAYETGEGPRDAASIELKVGPGGDVQVQQNMYSKVDTARLVFTKNTKHGYELMNENPNNPAIDQTLYFTLRSILMSEEHDWLKRAISSYAWALTGYGSKEQSARGRRKDVPFKCVSGLGDVCVWEATRHSPAMRIVASLKYNERQRELMKSGKVAPLEKQEIEELQQAILDTKKSKRRVDPKERKEMGEDEEEGEDLMEEDDGKDGEAQEEDTDDDDDESDSGFIEGEDASSMNKDIAAAIEARKKEEENSIEKEFSGVSRELLSKFDGILKVWARCRWLLETKSSSDPAVIELRKRAVTFLTKDQPPEDIPKPGNEEKRQDEDEDGARDAIGVPESERQRQVDDLMREAWDHLYYNIIESAAPIDFDPRITTATYRKNRSYIADIVGTTVSQLEPHQGCVFYVEPDLKENTKFMHLSKLLEVTIQIRRAHKTLLVKNLARESSGSAPFKCVYVYGDNEDADVESRAKELYLYHVIAMSYDEFLDLPFSSEKPLAVFSPVVSKEIASGKVMRGLVELLRFCNTNDAMILRDFNENVKEGHASLLRWVKQLQDASRSKEETKRFGDTWKQSFMGGLSVETMSEDETEHLEPIRLLNVCKMFQACYMLIDEPLTAIWTSVSGDRTSLHQELRKHEMVGFSLGERVLDILAIKNGYYPLTPDGWDNLRRPSRGTILPGFHVARMIYSGEILGIESNGASREIYPMNCHYDMGTVAAEDGLHFAYVPGFSISPDGGSISIKPKNAGDILWDSSNDTAGGAIRVATRAFSNSSGGMEYYKIVWQLEKAIRPTTAVREFNEAIRQTWGKYKNDLLKERKSADTATNAARAVAGEARTAALIKAEKDGDYSKIPIPSVNLKTIMHAFVGSMVPAFIEQMRIDAQQAVDQAIWHARGNKTLGLKAMRHAFWIIGSANLIECMPSSVPVAILPNGTFKMSYSVWASVDPVDPDKQCIECPVNNPEQVFWQTRTSIFHIKKEPSDIQLVPEANVPQSSRTVLATIETVLPRDLYWDSLPPKRVGRNSITVVSEKVLTSSSFIRQAARSIAGKEVLPSRSAMNYVAYLVAVSLYTNKARVVDTKVRASLFEKATAQRYDHIMRIAKNDYQVTMDELEDTITVAVMSMFEKTFFREQTLEERLGVSKKRASETVEQKQKPSKEPRYEESAPTRRSAEDPSGQPAKSAKRSAEAAPGQPAMPAAADVAPGQPAMPAAAEVAPGQPAKRSADVAPGSTSKSGHITKKRVWYWKDT